LKKTKAKIAAICMEPVHTEEPRDDFLQKVRAIADKIGAVMVFDEITVGWKLTYGGAHKVYGVNPDMAIFGKATSNGYPFAAIMGKKEIMQAAQETFISSSYWTEAIGPVAALATLKKMKKVNLPKHFKKIAAGVSGAWRASAKKYEMPIEVSENLAILTFALTGPDSQEAKTLFVQEMLQRGFLASNIFYATLAHKDEHVRKYAKQSMKSSASLQERAKKAASKNTSKAP
jgi:glutamate-1-semialdehyde 2,1-aminomutase